jgi:predicted Zn-dependent protease
VAEISRIEDLRRRLRKDPASIAFAQLAEELRRAGRPREAVTVCRTGLVNYPDYLSARVTLGRALLALGYLDDAERELERVRQTAPENLAAERALTELHSQRAGAVTEPEAADSSPTTEATARLQTVSSTEGAEYLRTVRTLTALESWLAAIHATRAERRP